MSKTAKKTVLIAKWTLDQDSNVDPPRTVSWGDGSAATQDDYLAHIEDTHTCVSGVDGMELHISTDIIADVHYDHTARTWVITGIDITPTTLGLNDAEALDDQIIAELYTFPIVYRARIHR